MLIKIDLDYWDKLIQQKEEKNDVHDGSLETMKGHRASLAGDQKAAANFFKTAAERGNTEGMYHYAIVLQRGVGCSVDLNRSEKWLRKASDRPISDPGAANAHHSLGCAYYYGTYGIRDHVRSAQHFQKAADNGLKESQTIMGSLYTKGQGVEMDYGKVMDYFNLAAEQGDGAAMVNMGQLYSTGGHGGNVDSKKALMWFQGARKRGCDIPDDWISGLEKRISDNADKDFRNLEKSEKRKIHALVQELRQEPSLHNVRSLDRWKTVLTERDHSPYMSMLAEGIDHGLLAVSMAEQGTNDDDVLKEFAKFARTDDVGTTGFPVPNKLMEVAIRVAERGPSVAAALCLAFTALHMGVQNQDSLLDLCNQFPEEISFQILYGSSFLIVPEPDFKKSTEIFTKVFEKHPEITQMLFLIASGEVEMKCYAESTKHFQMYVESAVKGHRDIPVAYFKMVQNIYYLKAPSAEFDQVDEKTKADALKLYYLGVEAEKDVHPLFRNNKARFWAGYFVGISDDENVDGDGDGIHKRPSILRRKNAMRKHREVRGQLGSIKLGTEQVGISLTVQPSMHQSEEDEGPIAPSISIAEMISNWEEKVYSDRCLEAMVISMPIKQVGCHVILQCKSDVIICSFYDFSEKQIKRLVFGQLLTIRQPYFKFAVSSGAPIIRVDNPDTVYFREDRSKKICWGCLEHRCKELKRCAGCNIARYCSKECQKADWNDLWHKKECGKA